MKSIRIPYLGKQFVYFSGAFSRIFQTKIERSYSLKKGNYAKSLPGKLKMQSFKQMY